MGILNDFRKAQGNDLPEFLYHGTSSIQYEKLKASNYEAVDLYLADVVEKSRDYAEIQANRDGSEELIILTIDAVKLVGNIEIDSGSNEEEQEYDMGQWIFTGNMQDAIVGEEIF